MGIKSVEMPAPVLITGCSRSGTSMIAGAIDICGAFGGEMVGPNRNNPRGMFENARIRNTIVKPYLEKLKVDRLGQYPLPKIEGLSIPTDWKQRVEKVMVDQGYKEGPWFYKGTKMSLTWPIWHYAFSDAKWIIVRRKTPDIIRSCMKTFFMKAFASPDIQRKVGAKDEKEGWLWWIHWHEQRFVEMITEGLNCKVVWPHRMVQGDYRQMMETVEWCGLEWNSAVLSFIDPKLWHSRQRR